MKNPQPLVSSAYRTPVHPGPQSQPYQPAAYVGYGTCAMLDRTPTNETPQVPSIHHALFRLHFINCTSIVALSSTSISYKIDLTNPRSQSQHQRPIKQRGEVQLQSAQQRNLRPNPTVKPKHKAQSDQMIQSNTRKHQSNQ
jgi:hypothetical protein